MRKKFATNLLFLVAVNLLIKPYWIFAIDRVVQNKVGPEVYGTYFAVFNVSYIFSIFLDFGINNFNNRAVSRNNKRMGEYLFNLLLLKLFLGLLYFAFTFFYALSTGMSEIQMKMLLYLALNQLLLSAVLYFRSNIAAMQLFKTDSFISVLDRLLTIIFCSLLMYGFSQSASFNIMWFIYAQTMALAITAVVAMVVVLSQSAIHTNVWKLRFSRLILAKSMPFAVLALLMSIYSRVDAVMLEKLMSNGRVEAGIYAASFRLLDAVNMFGYLFSVLLLPMFASMIRKRESTYQLVRFSSESMFVFSFTCAVLCFFFSDQIMQLLYANADRYWSQVFALLMFSFVPMSSVYVFGTLLTANGSMKLLIQIALIGVGVNLPLNYFLIPQYGALGCAIAALVTQMVVAGLHVAAAFVRFEVYFGASELVRILAFAVSVLAIGALASQPGGPWVFMFLLAGAGSMLAAVLAGLLPVRDIINMIKERTG